MISEMSICQVYMMQLQGVIMMGWMSDQEQFCLASFTGGPRYMYSHYLDALAICRVRGNPQFFITFTCNVKWPEIKRCMNKYLELTPADKPDIVDRVFEMKVQKFVRLLKENKTFGYITAGNSLLLLF